MAETKGGDACGFTNGKKTIKAAVKSYDYVHRITKQEDFPTLVCDFIGHTRYATIGNSKLDKNAHPFRKDHYVGVHNGSIYNHEDISELVNSESEVDSEILYEAIAKFGLKKTLPLLQGILALAYYDLRNRCIYLYRNNKPLHIGYKYTVDDNGQRVHTSLFWATMSGYLKAIDCEDIEMIKEHTLLKIKNGRIQSTKQIKQAQKPIEPFTYLKDNTKYYDKKRTVDIFKDRQDQIRALKDDYATKLLEEKNTVELSKTEVVLDDMDVPMNAFFFKSQSLGILVYWFLADKPHTIKIYNPETCMSEEYDLDMEEDLNVFNTTYSHDDSDIVQHVMKMYKEYKEMYMIRMEIENEEEKDLQSH